LPDSELDAQTAWARAVVTEQLGTIEPFLDPPDFGARRVLPRSFERATAISKRVSYADIDSTDFEVLLRQAADRLRLVYEAQSTGRDVSEADQAEFEIAAVLNPAKRGLRQGYGLPPAAKKAVEARAMELAEKWLLDNGYAMLNCSAFQPYDFEVQNGATQSKLK
jgi:hypothetical protein